MVLVNYALMLFLSPFCLLTPPCALPSAASAVSKSVIRHAEPLRYDGILKEVSYGGIQYVNMIGWLEVCAGKKDKCTSWRGDDDDFSKRGLDKPGLSNVSQNDATSLGRRNDAQNVVPEWIMCSDANGQNVVVFSKAQIITSLAAGFDLWQRFQQTPPNSRRRQYPHTYHKNKYTPRNLGAANPRQASSTVIPLNSSTEANSSNPRLLMEFPLFPRETPYSAGSPATERVIFDGFGEFAAVMTHRLTGNNQLRPCWEVDLYKNPINTTGVPGSNPNPPVVSQLDPTFQSLPHTGLALPKNTPYPDLDK